mmetsp:Transcript_9477/g.25760  ORF Transcript_9477/g.25760 Transcript_9477/m.25760 type:complete len:156 (+) Transcript_9477:128-595(+)
MSALTGARAGACVGRSTSRRLTHAMTSGRTQGVLVTRANHLAFRAAQGVRGVTCLRTCINQEQAQRNAVKQDTTCRVKLRFKRMGRKKRPFYRIVAIESRRKREGAALEELGWYNPLTKEAQINAESVEKWISNGAEPSETVANLIKKACPNILQ